MAQHIEEFRRRSAEFQGRISMLEANKQFLNGKISSLSLDMQMQDRNEQVQTKAIYDMNVLIKEKDEYLRQAYQDL